jgi:hypothetical protein
MSALKNEISVVSICNQISEIYPTDEHVSA